MKKFNPEKELSKIRNGNKKKIIGLVFLILIVSIISYSFALYQVKHSNKLVYTTVKDFKKRDIYLSVLVDGKTQTDFPKNNEGKIYSGIECDKPYSEAYFDNIKWELHFTSKGPNKCTVKFETGNLPNPPELYQGLIPVEISDTGIITVADTNTEWYNYDRHKWANAVLVDASNITIKNKYFNGNNLRNDIAGIQVPMEEVLQMYVWIPRYKYQLWNVNNENNEKQIINIKFEKGTDNTGNINCKYTNMGNGTIKEECTDKTTKVAVQNGDWYTHPAFKFGNTDLKGFWVGKFEVSDPTDITGLSKTDLNEIEILPNRASAGGQRNIEVYYNASRKIETLEKYGLVQNDIDTHMMKNMEWGAVAYLSQSIYGIYNSNKTCSINNMNSEECEIWVNNAVYSNTTVTGCSGTSSDATQVVVTYIDSDGRKSCDPELQWDRKGKNASTTGNITGIYDMRGGSNEYVMANIVTRNFDGCFTSDCIFIPDSNKYYDAYSYNESTIARSIGYFGDATKEMILSNTPYTVADWSGGVSIFPTNTSPRFMRGGWFAHATTNSIFRFQGYGEVSGNDSIRVVLTAQDGD